MQTEIPATFSRRLPLIVAAAFFMETLDGSIVATALPAIAHSFGQPTLNLAIGISAYLVTMVAFVPTAGWTSDRFGARTVFASAVGVFTLASLLCALSQSTLFFVVARCIQGMAAAYMSPVGRLVVLRETPKQYLIEAMGMIVWPGLIAPVLGPPLAGFLTTYLSWRWIFLLNLPIGALGAWLVLRMVPKYAVEARARFDTLGFVLTAAALALLIQGLSLMSSGDPFGGSGAALVVGGCLLGVLSVRHALRTPAPMLDLRGLSVPTFAVSSVRGGMLCRIAINATPFVLPLMFQIGFGMQPFEAGMMLLAYMLGNLVMKSATTMLLRRFGFTNVLTINGALCAAAIAGCALLSPSTARLLIYAVLVFAGMTRSMQLTTVTALAFADVAAAHRAGASTLAAMMQQLALTLGVAFAALALAMSQHARAAPSLALPDFRNALLGAALLMAIGTAWTRQLPRDAGADLSRRT